MRLIFAKILRSSNQVLTQLTYWTEEMSSYFKIIQNEDEISFRKTKIETFITNINFI